MNAFELTHDEVARIAPCCGRLRLGGARPFSVNYLRWFIMAHLAQSEPELASKVRHLDNHQMQALQAGLLELQATL